jgi:hypothetical protein
VPAREGSTQRFRVELLKFTSRGHIECVRRSDFDDENAALAAWATLARPSRVRARLVAAITQEWVEPAQPGSGGVRFATHRLYQDGHARREVQ